MFRILRSTAAAIVLLAAASLATAKSAAQMAAGPPCGLAPTDWCPAPSNDPCSRHRDDRCRTPPAPRENQTPFSSNATTASDLPDPVRVTPHTDSLDIS